MEPAIETMVEQAKEGHKDALEALIRSIQDRIYGLSIRMLYHPADAEDATQEILIKVITHLDSFRGESAFTTWVYRIASNHLLTTQKCRAERRETTFESIEKNIERPVAETAPAPILEPEQSLIAQEIMISCMQGMLICLDRNLRIAYILGEISEITGDKAADILNISPAAFRKRLSRARTLLRNFMQKKCGLVNPDNPCRCSRYVGYVVKTGAGKPERLLFAGHPCRSQKDVVTQEQLQEMNELQRIVMLFRSHPDYAAPETFVEEIKKLV
jgi:RNA polymerase sigma factor (sigma-70 family)